MTFSDTFKIDQNFLKKLHNRLRDANADFFNTVDGKFEDSPLDLIPSLKHLEEIISGMFWASTQMEEGRLLRFRTIYSKPTGLSYLGLDFENPIAWESEEIRKLASAVTPPDGRMCVYPTSKRGKLFIQGMQSKIGIRDPLSLVFEIIEPARITIQFPQNKKVAEITGQRAGFVDEEWNDAGRELISLGAIRKKGNKSKPSDFLLLYSNMTQEVLSRMRLLRHGGSLIFIPDSIELEDSLETPIKYKCNKRFNAVKSIEKSVKDSMEYESGKTDPLDAFRTEIKTLGKSLNKLRMADSARTIAYLTAVDGATILNSKFEVLAFGAKIKEPQNEGDKQTVKIMLPLEDFENEKPTLTTLTDEFRGKRHLSVARFVSNNPGSIGFAVSQDGGITGFIMNQKHLTAYRGLELLI